MNKHPLGSRYASALFEIAQERGTLDQTLEDLDTVSQVLKETKLLEEVFRHPNMTGSRKKEILKQTFAGKVSQPVLSLMQLLVDNKRESLFNPIMDNFKSLSYEAQGVGEADVFSAKPLSEEEKAAVAAVFAKRSGKAKLLINNVVDKDVIGGLRVRIGDTVYDGTVANQLLRIHDRMVAGNNR